MTDRLHMTPSGRWAIGRLGETLVEITSGDLIMVQVGDERDLLKLTRIECDRTQKTGHQYYSVDGYVLREGLRAAFPERVS